MTRPSKRMIAALLAMIVIGAWTAAFAYLWIGNPTTAQWAAAVKLAVQRTSDEIERLLTSGRAKLQRLDCQTAFKRDPRSASKRDPLFG